MNRSSSKRVLSLQQQNTSQAKQTKLHNFFSLYSAQKQKQVPLPVCPKTSNQKVYKSNRDLSQNLTDEYITVCHNENRKSPSEAFTSYLDLDIADTDSCDDEANTVHHHSISDKGIDAQNNSELNVRTDPVNDEHADTQQSDGVCTFHTLPCSDIIFGQKKNTANVNGPSNEVQTDIELSKQGSNCIPLPEKYLHSPLVSNHRNSDADLYESCLASLPCSDIIIGKM